MISERRLKKELLERYDKYIESCNALTVLKANGYNDCFNDVFNIVDELVEENRIKASARRSVKKLLGR